MDIEEACEDACESIEFERIPPERLAQPGAGWPVSVTHQLRTLYSQLTHKRRNKRAQLLQVIQSLSAMLQLDGPTCAAPCMPASPDEASASSGAVCSSACAPHGHVSAPPSQLSQQVRRMRPTGTSLKQNMAEGFDSAMYQLEELYCDRDAEAPPPGEFELRLRFWHQVCDLPAEIHERMQTLRKWRNASLHRDDSVWQRNGPRTAEAASLHLSALQSAIDQVRVAR